MKYHLIVPAFLSLAMASSAKDEGATVKAVFPQDFEEISQADYARTWQKLSNQFSWPGKVWPRCDVTVNGGDLSVKFLPPTELEARPWPPQQVGFSTDMSEVNRRFKEPTQMMPLGERGWLCDYSHGEFGNGCWIMSLDGKTKDFLTGHEVVSMRKSQNKYFVTTYDSTNFMSAFSELNLSGKPKLRVLFESMFPLEILDSEDDGSVYLISEEQLCRWNVKDRTSVSIRFPGDFLPYLAADAHTACAIGGRYWIGGTGVLCSLDPFSADLSIRVYVPKRK